LELIKQKKKAAKAKENNGTISFMEVLTNTIEEITEKEKEKDRIQEAEDLAKEEQELKQQEELEKLKELPVENKAVLDLKSLKLLFDRVDYHTFCLIVLIGGIGGRHLIALYKGSEKLKEYFDRAFQPVDKNGQLINDPQKEHLFRLVLDQIGIRIQPYSFVFNYQTPKNVYFDRFIGGEVWCFGSNNVGQLGLRGGQERKIPVLNQSLNNVIQISSAGDQVLCLNNKGQVIAFGQNHKGQLGLGNYNVRRIPKIIPALVNIVQVNTSHHHSLCLDNQGRVWSFGFNESGQLGLGDYDNRNIPEMIPNLNNIIQVASGRSFSICLDSDGHVWSFGDNTNAKLGKGNWGGMEPIPTVIKDFENIKQISCGEYHTLWIRCQH